MSPTSLPDAAANLPDMFAALGHRTRLAILGKLSDGQPRSIIVLSADTDLTRQAVSKHLRVLERAGLVSSIRAGRESRFTYNPQPIVDARAYLDTVSAHWDAALSRLQQLVERDEERSAPR